MGRVLRDPRSGSQNSAQDFRGLFRVGGRKPENAPGLEVSQSGLNALQNLEAREPGLPVRSARNQHQEGRKPARSALGFREPLADLGPVRYVPPRGKIVGALV